MLICNYAIDCNILYFTYKHIIYRTEIKEKYSSNIFFITVNEKLLYLKI